MNIGIFGRGRLASAAAKAAAASNTGAASAHIEILWSLGRGQEPGAKVDAALDASLAPAVPAHIEWALDTHTNLAIGATGWDSGLLNGLDKRAREAGIAILFAPNFSLGIALCRAFASALGRYSQMSGTAADLSVFERHHRAKADSPSGTAKMLACALAEGAGMAGWAPSPAPSDRVPVASLREGMETGFHEMRLDSDMETIVISHAAKSRELFGAGAIRALIWMRGREGLYSFDDMAADAIAPLFSSAGAGLLDTRGHYGTAAENCAEKSAIHSH